MFELLSTRQFADRVGVVPETVRRWVRSGKLGPYGRTPTGQLRFTQIQVEQALGLGPTARAQDLDAHVLAARRKVERLRRVI
jgi:predicted site-specific integrase-resolvase